MTVASTTNRKTFAGDNVTTSFGTSPVVFFETSNLVVSVVTDATGASTTLTENTGYTVTGGSGSTGTVDTSGGTSPHGALLTGTTLVILRVLPLTQSDDYVNNDIMDAEVLEDRMDRLTMIAQQLDEVDGRSLKLSAEETTSDALIELPFDRASKYLAFNASKELIASSGTDGVGAVPVSAFMNTVLDDTTAALARRTLGVIDITLNTAVTPTAAATRDMDVATTLGGVTAQMNRVMVSGVGITTNGTSPIIIQLGDAGGVETTGYDSIATEFKNGAGTFSGGTSTAGFLVIPAPAAASTYSFTVEIWRVTGNTWSARVTGQDTGNGYVYVGHGTKALSQTLNQVRFTMANGTDLFDATGTMNVSYE